MRSKVLTKLEVKDVIERYFHALDARDGDLLASCFAGDVEATYHAGTEGEFVQKGIDSVVGYLVGTMDNYHVRSHATANSEVTILGPERARCLTHAMAVLWKKDRIHVRGLRYRDELRLEQGEWRIYSRQHSPLWQFDADPSAPVVPAHALAASRAAAAGA